MNVRVQDVTASLARSGYTQHDTTHATSESEVVRVDGGK